MRSTRPTHTQTQKGLKGQAAPIDIYLSLADSYTLIVWRSFSLSDWAGFGAD